jgi:uncharacterized protein (UPF0218 family)
MFEHLTYKDVKGLEYPLVPDIHLRDSKLQQADMMHWVRCEEKGMAETHNVPGQLRAQLFAAFEQHCWGTEETMLWVDYSKCRDL